MSMFQKATRRMVKIKMAITGPSGSGKTVSALRLAHGLCPGGRIGVADTENRSASLYADHNLPNVPPFNFEVVDIGPPFDDMAKFANVIRAAEQEGLDVLILDSGSHVWEGILNYKSKLDAGGTNSYTNWNKAGQKFKDIIDALLQSDIHIIVCLRAKMEYILEEQERNGRKTQVPRKVGMAPIIRDGIEYEFTTVFDLDISHNAQCSKDRSGLFGDQVFTISEKTGEAIRQWLSTAQPATPANTALASPEQTERIKFLFEEIPCSANLRTKCMKGYHYGNLPASLADSIIGYLNEKLKAKLNAESAGTVTGEAASPAQGATTSEGAPAATQQQSCVEEFKTAVAAADLEMTDIENYVLDHRIGLDPKKEEDARELLLQWPELKPKMSAWRHREQPNGKGGNRGKSRKA